MKSFVTIAIMFNLAVLAELPPSLDDVLFSMTGGTNYVAWMAAEGEIAFRKPFSLFGSARFQSFHPTNDVPSFHYSITMEKRFYCVTSPSNIIESLKQAEGVLQKQFEQRFSHRRDNISYQSKCIDIDGLGWDASFCVEPVSDGNAMPTYIAKAVFYNSLHKEGRFVSCEDLFNKCECGQSAPVVVVASTPAFSNVCKAVGASIRVLDLRNISQKDLIWITEEVDLILATRDFTREELDRLAKAASVECVNWDYEDVSPKGVEYLTSIIHKHREERRICAEILDRRSKMSDEERIAEYYALIEKEDCGPFEFKDALASDVFTGVLQRINGHLRRRHSEYEFSGSYGVTGVEMVNDASITNRHYTLYIPRMPPLKMWQYVAEQLNCSITNRNGFIEMEQMFTPAEKVNPNIVNVTVPIPAMTNDAACFACESKPGDFTIYAAHYAKKGYCRFGMTGLGDFLEYSFGRTNYCDSTAFEVHEGTNKFMCVTNSIVHISKDFDVATLYHDAKSRRLFKASVSRSLPDSMSVADRIKFLNSISKAFDYMYRIKVPIPCAADVGALMKNNHGEWSIERGDDLFLLTLSLSVSDNKSIRVTMMVESKQVRHPIKRRPDDTKDVEVELVDPCPPPNGR